MTQIIIKIKSYGLFRMGFESTRDMPALITLQGEDPNQRVIIVFADKEANLRNAEAYTQDNGIQYVSIRLHDSKYQKIVDILRNEKPLTFIYNDNQKLSYIYTSSAEPIGDAELTSL